MATPVGFFNPEVSKYFYCPYFPDGNRADPTEKSCLPFVEVAFVPNTPNVSQWNDHGNYTYAKYSYSSLLGSILEKYRRSTPDSKIVEVMLIYWLLGRELGQHLLSDENIVNDVFQANIFESNLTNPDTSVIRFWRAKIALILLSDIDNPYSQKFLRLHLASSKDRPVFAITIPKEKTTFSLKDRMLYLREVYVKLIRPLGDPLLEAECLLMQHQLVAREPELARFLGPVAKERISAADLPKVSHLFIDINQPILEFRPTIAVGDINSCQVPEKTKELLRQALHSKMTAYLEDRLDSVISINPSANVKYIYSRIPPEGYNDLTGNAYWDGGKMRTREANRYISQAKRMKAQFLLFSSRYNSPDLAGNLANVQALIGAAQGLVTEYDESPRELAPYAAGAYQRQQARRSGVPGFVRQPEPDFGRIGFQHGDFLNLLSQDLTRAAAYYQLGITFQFSNPAESDRNFKLAEEITYSAVYNLKKYDEYIKRRREDPAAIAVDKEDGITLDSYLWRESILGSAKLLLSNIYLAQNKQTTVAVEEVRETLDSPDHLLRGDAIIGARLALVSATLQDKKTTYAEQQAKVYAAARALAPLLSETYNAAGDPKGEAAIAIVVNTAITDKLPETPYTALYASRIRLAQAKVVLALYYLDDTRSSLPQKVVELLTPQIDAAQLGESDFNPTPFPQSPDVPANNGVFEDYELSTALQMRADAKFALDDLNSSREDYERALSVYQDATRRPLNYFAQLGMGDIHNWRELHTTSKESYEAFQTSFAAVPPNSPVMQSAFLQAKLGLAEIVLRQKTLIPGEKADAEANAVIAIAKEILETSDELYLIERALASLTEAIIAKKENGSAELQAIMGQFTNGSINLNMLLTALAGTAKTAKIPIAHINPNTSASLRLQVADGLLYIHKYVLAYQLLDGFDTYNRALLERDRALEIHYQLSLSEIELKLNIEKIDEAALRAEYSKAIVQARTAIRDIFTGTIPSVKRDPFIVQRALKGLVDMYANIDEFEFALAITYRFQGLTGEALLAKLQATSGILDPSKFAEATRLADDLFDEINMPDLFNKKGMAKRWELLVTDMQLKQAEMLVWTQNYELALATLKEVESRGDKEVTLPDGATKFKVPLIPLQKARIAIARGNIVAQWKHDRSQIVSQSINYRDAIEQYIHAELILDRLNNDEQQVVLAKSELYLNLANISTYGEDYEYLPTALRYFKTAWAFVQQIKGNEDLKNYYLFRIYSGLALIAQKSIPAYLKLPIEIDPTESTYLPVKLLDRSREFLDQIIIKSKFSVKQAERESEIGRVNASGHPGIATRQSAGTGFTWRGTPGTFDNRLSGLNLTVTKPITFGTMQIEPALQIDRRGRGATNILPGIFFSPAPYANIGGYVLPNLNNPDTTLSFYLSSPWNTPGLRGVSLAGTANFNAGDLGISNYYANAGYSFDKDFRLPLVQGIRVDAEYLHLNSLYAGLYSTSDQVSLMGRWALDLKQLQLLGTWRWLDRQPWFVNNLARIVLGLGPLYSSGRDAYSVGGVEKHKSTDTYGVQGEACFEINPGWFFKVSTCYKYKYENTIRQISSPNDHANTHQVETDIIIQP